MLNRKQYGLLPVLLLLAAAVLLLTACAAGNPEEEAVPGPRRTLQSAESVESTEASISAESAESAEAQEKAEAAERSEAPAEPEGSDNEAPEPTESPQGTASADAPEETSAAEADTEAGSAAEDAGPAETSAASTQEEDEEQPAAEARRIPVLMYHHLDETGDDTATISVTKFREQLELLREYGYTPVALQALRDYVEQGVPLPEKPVVLTFDDGYYSSYQYAFPILQELQYPAAIFVIGSSFGHMQYYKDTGYEVIPHFGQTEAEELLASGLITIQSHTYDLHQWPSYENSEAVRENMLPLASDSPEAYEALITEDLAEERELLRSVGVPELYASAYPEGKHTEETDRILRENGILMTFTTDSEAENLLVRGDPDSLMNLGRMNLCEATDREALLAYLERNSD